MFEIFKKKKISKEEKAVIKQLRKIPKTTQKTIPYVSVSPNGDGIIEITKGKYSTTIEFADINYQIARLEDQEEIFLQYAEILNYFDSSYEIEITIHNKYINPAEFKEMINIPLQSDGFDDYRKEYNQMLQHQVLEGKNNIQKVMYLTVCTECKSYEEARTKFSKLYGEIQNNFKRIGSKTKVLGLEERLEMLHDIFRPGEEGEFQFNINDIKKKCDSTKNLIAPDSFRFDKDYFTMGEKYGRVLFLKSLPATLNDKFLNELTELDRSSLISVYIKPIEMEKALKIIKHQITGMEGNKIEYQKRSLKNGYLEAFIPYELRNSLEEAKELLDDVTNKNQKVFLVSLIVSHFADSKEELNQDTEVLKSIASKNLCKLGNLNYQQEQAMKTVLPLGNNLLKVDRTLTTESTAVFMPFNCEELLQSNGMYYGINATSRNLLMFNRKNTKNGNGFILGTPGSGKSFAAKREITNVFLNSDDDIIIIDPDGEYTSLVENFGGEVINISAGAKNHINPLDLSEDYSDDEDPLILKSDFILSLCECLIGGKEGLKASEKTIIDRCCKIVYTEYIASNFEKSKVPTLLDFQDVLENQQEPEAKDLALALEIYTKGSLSIFAHKTNVNTSNRLVCYNIKELGKQLKTMGMLIVLDAIWNRITENRSKGKRTWINIDEIYLLFANEYSAQYLYELYKRARKWGGLPTGITQNISDLLKSDLASSMLANSDFILMLNQAPQDRKELAKLLNISDTQLSYVTSSNPGEGLLFNGSSIVPFVDNFPKDTELYKMMTTKIDEVVVKQEKVV